MLPSFMQTWGDDFPHIRYAIAESNSNVTRSAHQEHDGGAFRIVDPRAPVDSHGQGICAVLYPNTGWTQSDDLTMMDPSGLGEPDPYLSSLRKLEIPQCCTARDSFRGKALLALCATWIINDIWHSRPSSHQLKEMEGYQCPNRAQYLSWE